MSGVDIALIIVLVAIVVIALATLRGGRRPRS